MEKHDCGVDFAAHFCPLASYTTLIPRTGLVPLSLIPRTGLVPLSLIPRTGLVPLSLIPRAGRVPLRLHASVLCNT